MHSARSNAKKGWNGGDKLGGGEEVQESINIGQEADEKYGSDVIVPILQGRSPNITTGSVDKIDSQPDSEKGFIPPRSSPYPPPYSSNDVPTAEAYHRFYWKCMALKSELIRLDFALRSVAASGLGIQATHDLKRSLLHLRDLYGINTAVLYPDDSNVKFFRPINTRQYLGRFSLCFKNFGEALNATAKALYIFNDVYHDETLTLQLFTLEKRFQRESIKLKEPDGLSRMGEDAAKACVQVLLDDWIEKAIESLVESVGHYHEKGIKKISQAQKSKSSRYFDMTTIATFFSAVTASMIQTTALDVDTKAGVAANTFFFSSLVFSIASAVNSLLVMSWMRSVVHEPEGELTLWLKAWLSMGPMMSLITSGIFFAVGLCLSAFSTKQHLVTSLVTIGFSGMHAMTLFTLAFLHVRAKWTFRKKSGKIGKDLTRDSIVLAVLDWVWSILWPPSRDTDQSSVRSTSDIDIAQVEEGTVKPRSIRSVNSKDVLRGLLPQDDDDYEQLTREWNALADEDFVLPYSYVKDEIQSPPSSPKEASIAPKRSVSRRRGRSPPPTHISTELLPRLSTDSGARQDLDSRLNRERQRDSIARLKESEKCSRSSERRTQDQVRSRISIVESIADGRDNVGSRRASRVRPKKRKESVVGFKSNIDPVDFHGEIRIEEGSEEESERLEYVNIEAQQATENRRSAYDHSPSHSSNAAVVSTSRRRERNRSPSRHSSRSRHHSTSTSSESTRSRRRRRRRRRARSSDSDSSSDDSESDSSSSSEDTDSERINRIEEVLNNFADRIAPKTSGVHAAAKFLPPSDKAFRTTETPPPNQTGKKKDQNKRHRWQRNPK